MSRTGINYHDVKNAIATLQGRQKNPTVDNIRDVLGTGSKSTIARLLREWKAQHGLAEESDGKLPTELQAMVNGFWDALCNKAEEKIDAHQKHTDEKLAEMEAQLTQIKQSESKLKLDLHTLEELKHRNEADLRALNATLAHEAQEKVKLAERAAALDSRCQDNLAENQRLHQHLKHVQDNLEHYQAAMQQQRLEQSLILEKQQHDYEQRLRDATQQLQAANADRAATLAKHENLMASHEALAAEQQATLAKLHDMLNQHAVLKATNEALTQAHQALSLEVKIQDQAMTSMQHQLITLELTAKTAQERAVQLEAALAKAEDKIETLRSENQFVMQEKASLEGQIKQMQSRRVVSVAG